MSPRVKEIYEQRVKAAVVDAVRELSPEERLEMIELITREAASAPGRRRRSWKEAIGVAPYPLCGEDAQEWITRMRHGCG